MEQTEVQAATGPNDRVLPSKGPALSNQVRASMEAVRVAVEAARARARRQTLMTRLWFATSVAALALAAVAWGPRVARWRHARAQAKVTTAPQALPSVPEPAPPAIASAAAATGIGDIPGPSAGMAEPSESPATAPAALAALGATAPAALGEHPEKACDTALIRRAPWRLSPDACARAFDADPNNASLALAVAHAAYVRGRFADAAQWAQRALVLDANVAEAYVITARTEKVNGRQEEARAAYAHYLELAPRGWHKAEARAAVERGR